MKRAWGGEREEEEREEGIGRRNRKQRIRGQIGVLKAGTMLLPLSFYGYMCSHFQIPSLRYLRRGHYLTLNLTCSTRPVCTLCAYLKSKLNECWCYSKEKLKMGTPAHLDVLQ